MTQISLDNSWYFWVYLQNIAYTFNWKINGPNHYWSLAVEEHFYLIWPFFIFLFKAKNVKYFSYSLIVVSLITRIVLYKNGILSFYFTITNLDSLACGSLLAYHLYHKGNVDYSPTSPILKIRHLILFFLLSISFIYVYVGSDLYSFFYCFKPLLLSILYLNVIRLLIVDNKFTTLKMLVSNPLFVYVGKVSYGFYVYHPLIFLIYFNFISNSHRVKDFVLLFVINVIVSTTSYYLFENRILALKKFLKSNH